MKTSELKSGRRTKRLRLTMLLAIVLLAWSLLAWGLARSLIVRAELPHADALVVLSGAATYRERTRRAAELWKQGRAPRIIITNDRQMSGWSRAEQRNPFFYELAVAQLRGDGVPPDKIEVLPEQISGTYEEALLLKVYAEKNKLRSVIVVTSAYHSRRALWTMRRVFAGTGISIGLEPAPAGQQTPTPATWWLHVRGWQMVAGEYVKMVYYRIR